MMSIWDTCESAVRRSNLTQYPRMTGNPWCPFTPVARAAACG